MINDESTGTDSESRDEQKEVAVDLLPPGEENILINGVSSDGLLRCAICNLRPVGPETPF